MMSELLMASKYRGCLLGSLLGDCLGAPYEGESNVSKVVLQQYFDKLSGPYFKAPVKMYTDDTAMTRCLASNIIDKGKVDAADLAKRFTVEYFNDPRRGYGHNIIDVFHKLRATKFENPFGPAQEQFGGSGSCGNGGAMRVAPVPLMYRGSLQDVIENARLSAIVTHTNKLGVDGAILQAVAIHESLNANPKDEFNTKQFSDKLIKVLSTVEKDEEGLGLEDPTPYQARLHEVQRLLDIPEGATDEDVQQTLGHHVTALESVPTAIFCFLRATTKIPEIETENPLRRTLQYAISLGGDTDTIASMAGAIAGAFYGDSHIPDSLKKHCEGSKDMIQMADALQKLSSSKS